MNRFIEIAEKIPGVFSIRKNILGDSRGYLERLFCASELSSWAARPVAQVNRTFSSKKGTVRGLHFQRHPFCEAKLICCLKGKVMDYALDLRKNSKTFGQTFTIELSSKSHNSVLLPEGVAHGFQALTDNVEMLYFHSHPYKSDHEAGVNMLDLDLGIKLPLNCTNISDRDLKLPSFKELKEQI